MILYKLIGWINDSLYSNPAHNILRNLFSFSKKEGVKDLEKLELFTGQFYSEIPNNGHKSRKFCSKRVEISTP